MPTPLMLPDGTGTQLLAWTSLSDAENATVIGFVDPGGQACQNVNRSHQTSYAGPAYSVTHRAHASKTGI